MIDAAAGVLGDVEQEMACCFAYPVYFGGDRRGDWSGTGIFNRTSSAGAMSVIAYWITYPCSKTSWS